MGNAGLFFFDGKSERAIGREEGSHRTPVEKKV